MNAIIIAGGKGSRMAPFTNSRPKSMVGILDKPLLQYQIEQLRDAGIQNIAIQQDNKNHSPLIQRFFGDGSRFDVSITHRPSSELLGTAGNIRDGLLALGETEESAVVFYGDIFSDIDLKELVAAHKESGHSITGVTVPKKLPFGVFYLSNQEDVVDFVEKPTLDSSAGMFVIERDMATLLPESGDFTGEFLTQRVKRGDFSIGTYQHNGFFANVNSLGDLDRVEEWLLRREGVSFDPEIEQWLRSASQERR